MGKRNYRETPQNKLQLTLDIEKYSPYDSCALINCDESFERVFNMNKIYVVIGGSYNDDRSEGYHCFTLGSLVKRSSLSIYNDNPAEFYLVADESKHTNLRRKQHIILGDVAEMIMPNKLHEDVIILKNVIEKLINSEGGSTMFYSAKDFAEEALRSLSKTFK